jgi:hypothetical protein
MSISRWITPGKTIIKPKLDEELRAAGIPIDGVGGAIERPTDIRIDFQDTATQQQQTTGTDAVVAAHPLPTPIADYARSHEANRAVFLKALYKLETTIDLHTTAGLNLQADYQAALSAAMAVVNTLPQPYIDNLNKVRDLDGVAVAVGSLTLAQCRQFAATLRGWLNTRAIMADTSAEMLD